MWRVIVGDVIAWAEVAAFRAQPDARPVILPQPASLALFLRDD